MEVQHCTIVQLCTIDMEVQLCTIDRMEVQLYHILYGPPTLYYRLNGRGSLYGGPPLYYRLYGSPTLYIDYCRSNFDYSLYGVPTLYYSQRRSNFCSIVCMDVQLCTIVYMEVQL